MWGGEYFFSPGILTPHLTSQSAHMYYIVHLPTVGQTFIEEYNQKGKWLNGLGLLSLLHISNLETGPAWGLLSLNQSTGPLLLLARMIWIGTVSVFCGGMFHVSIIQIFEIRVKSTRFISGNLLKTLLLILMSIAHIYSLLWISYVLMSPYRGGTDRVVIIFPFYPCLTNCWGV